jgi:acyl-CoA thioesterase-1
MGESWCLHALDAGFSPCHSFRMQCFVPRLLPLMLAMASLVLSTPASAQDNTPVQIAEGADPVKLACVGDSITSGMGASKPYPMQLQTLLGKAWEVKNFGVSGTTLLNGGDNPYQKTTAFADAKAYLPQVVVIMLGTNDTKPQNWKLKDQYVPDYKDLIEKFKALPSNPRIFIAMPVPVMGGGNYGIVESGIQQESAWIPDIARDENVGLIDLHGALKGHDADFPDKVHPNDDGAHRMAVAVAKALTGSTDPAP